MTEQDEDFEPYPVDAVLIERERCAMVAETHVMTSREGKEMRRENLRRYIAETIRRGPQVHSPVPQKKWELPPSCFPLMDAIKLAEMGIPFSVIREANAKALRDNGYPLQKIKLKQGTFRLPDDIGSLELADEVRRLSKALEISIPDVLEMAQQIMGDGQ